MKYRYDPAQFAAHWQRIWEEEGVYRAEEPRTASESMHILDMFPYPSGAGLHVGHPRGYTATDILSRYYRMQGKAVLHPMGWDAFGLPAENAAIKAKTNPKKLVPHNIENFKRQMQMLGFSYDWEREFATIDPTYFKWTQWLFIQFFKMGLLYKKNTPINYCPSCKTGLAEEEVLPDGTHERCGSIIEKKDLPQWIFRITKYADELLGSLEGLEWPKGILEMQKNWIGRKEGINITYPIKDTSETVTCFTTRPDTNFGATFIVVAPEHPLVKRLLEREISHPSLTAEVLEDIQKYVAQAQSKSQIERTAEGVKKTGVFTGLSAINRLNGASIPIWISDFVLVDFGTGAVVGVPGHDLRDFDFALTFGLPVIRVVISSDGDTSPIENRSQVQEDEGVMTASGFLDGMDIHKAKEVMMDHLEREGMGKRVVSYHLRDWIFSRQRYWGEPIPMVYCVSCAQQGVSGVDAAAQDLEYRTSVRKKDTDAWRAEVRESLFGWFPLPEDQLPLDLPDVPTYEPLESGESPLAAIPEFVETICPHCGGSARRETDTMPNWAGSCWYFLYFGSREVLNNSSHKRISHPSRRAWDTEIGAPSASWMPVSWYVGGAEHAVLHLLYARFWMYAMYDIGLVETQEPFLRLRNVGMILAEDNRKMSKSWGNVINPDDVVREYGADALRMYEMFMAPFSQEIAWSTRTLQGTFRFLKRVFALVSSSCDSAAAEIPASETLRIQLAKTVQKVTDDIPDIKFNTAIAAMMEFLNTWERDVSQSTGKLTHEQLCTFVQILAPFAPFTAEELWRGALGQRTSVHRAAWPQVHAQDLVLSRIDLPVQVNGRMRAVISVSADASDEEIIAQAKGHEKVMPHLLDGSYKKAIVVRGKIVNFIV